MTMSLPFTRSGQDRSPENLERPTIDSMVTSQVAYTLPWGMWVDNTRCLWLHPKYPITDEVRGTSRMRIELRHDGYHVWPPADETWSPSKEPGYASPEDTEYIPVVKLHR
ncbi:MAG: hypothetical protein JWM00_434 [Candidatus Saccharibacteria bacterium]|nr:hypothetical protein [Candidatus Saccharibacteria bacterium]